MAVITHSVDFPAGDRRLGGLIARPAGDGPFRAIVVVHEAFGLNDNIKDIARRLADEGYLAFAVDLFSGRNRAACLVRLFAGMTFNALNHGGIHDLAAALAFLVEQPHVDPNRVGAIGFCLGGSLTIAWACTDDRLNVVAPFYGISPSPIDAIARSCPLVGSFPRNDPTASHGRKLAAACVRHDVPHDIKIYPGTAHSFFNDQGRTYNAAAADDSWRRTLAFFEKYL